MIETSGIPIADYFWGIKAYLQKGDSARSTVDLYSDVGYFSIIDSITLEPYRLIGSIDTIRITNRYQFYWKPNYRIDTLRFKVYLKPNLELTYDRFSTSSMSFAYKTASYDSSQRVARFTVGISTMSSEPNIVLQPFGKIDYLFENSYIKVISRFFYQQQRKVVPWLLP
ncbi:MAG: hypothetical protein C0417_03970 [Chlorobiaceae bacterium]|nr:hypothetical protein [Chlorobiaceae bacterium]